MSFHFLTVTLFNPHFKIRLEGVKIIQFLNVKHIYTCIYSETESGREDAEHQGKDRLFISADLQGGVSSTFCFQGKI